MQWFDNNILYFFLCAYTINSWNNASIFKFPVVFKKDEESKNKFRKNWNFYERPVFDKIDFDCLV